MLGHEWIDSTWLKNIVGEKEPGRFQFRSGFSWLEDTRGCEMPAKPPSAQERFERRQARRQVKKVGRRCSLCLFWNVSRVEDGLEMLGIAVYTRAFVIPFAAAPWQVYWSRTQTGWQGGRNLSDSAAYTSLFARALLQCWCRFLSDSRCSKHARVC